MVVSALQHSSVPNSPYLSRSPQRGGGESAMMLPHFLSSNKPLPSRLNPGPGISAVNAICRNN